MIIMPNLLASGVIDVSLQKYVLVSDFKYYLCQNFRQKHFFYCKILIFNVLHLKKM